MKKIFVYGIAIAALLEVLTFAAPFALASFSTPTVAVTSLPISYGGTNATSQTTNGVTFFDGTRVTSGTTLVFTGTALAIGTTTPFWNLTIASSTGPQLALVDGTGASSAWTFRSIANTFYIATSSETATSSAAAMTLLPSGQMQLNSQKPTAATSTGSGTGNVPVTITGNATDFNFNITTGSAPAGSNAVIATFTMPSACSSATVPVWSDANANTDALAVISVVYASSTGRSTFNLVSGATGLGATTNYIWNFHVGCY